MKNQSSLPCPDLCSFIHSGCFYSASSSPLLLRGASDTARILCRSFTPKRHRQLRVKDLPKVPTPATLRMKGAESTNEPPRLTSYAIGVNRGCGGLTTPEFLEWRVVVSPRNIVKSCNVQEYEA